MSKHQRITLCISIVCMAIYAGAVSRDESKVELKKNRVELEKKVQAQSVQKTTTERAKPSTTVTIKKTPTTFESVLDAGGPVIVPPDLEGGYQTAKVSWYGTESGTRTANGENFTGNSYTFAHLTMPFGTLVEFCNGEQCVMARCNDRGPAAWTGKTFDLSRATFQAIGDLSSGTMQVRWKKV